jgi:hypothetical protein
MTSLTCLLLGYPESRNKLYEVSKISEQKTKLPLPELTKNSFSEIDCNRCGLQFENTGSVYG